MAHRIPAPLRAIGAVLRALLGLALLAALVAGVPYLLLKVGHQPTELVGGFSLLEQDDGTLFLVTLTCIGWAGWAAFTFSVLLELMAVLRRRSAPRIKGLSGLQSLASFLIGGIVLLAPTAASAATLPTVAAAATHTAGDSTTTAESSSAASAAHASAADWPKHTVTSTTELPWDLAEEYLGAGTRWKDIAALNPEIPQLVAGDQYLPNGAVIKLPADARPVAPASSTAPGVRASSNTTKASPQHDDGKNKVAETADETATSTGEDSTDRPDRVTVHKGDSLWSIADEHGDASDWPAIYEANKDEPTPDGGTFDNPNLIFPGQVLDLPEPKTAKAPPADQPAAKPKTPAKPDNTQNAETPQQNTSDVDAEADQNELASATPPPSHTAQAPSTTAPPPSATSTPAPAVRHSDEDSSVSTVMYAAGGALVAGGVVMMLRRRRALQRRRRGDGQRIAMPTGRTAAAEQALRSVDSSTELRLLDAVLRTLADQLAAQEQALPPVAAVQLGTEGVLLHLSATEADSEGGAEPSAIEPVVPFTAVEGHPGVWWCPADSADLLDEESLSDVPAPYPGLVPLGEDTTGGILLVDVEEFGALHLTGSRRTQLLRTLGISLALSPLSDQIDILVAGEDTAPGLSMLDSQRVHPHENLDTAATAARGHHADQQRLLTTSGLPDLFHARVSDDAEEFDPLVILADLETCPSAEAMEQLAGILADEPLSSTVVITSSAQPARATSGGVWEIDTDSPALPVPNTPLHCVLSMCTDEEYADVLELALTADSPTDIPPAEPVPLSTLLPGTIPGLIATPPAPTAPAPGSDSVPSGASPSLLAVLADLDDDPEDAGEDDEAEPARTEGSGAGTDPDQESAPRNAAAAELPQQFPLAEENTTKVAGDTSAPAGAADVKTAGAEGTNTSVVPIPPSSATPGHAVRHASRALPQISIRLPAPSSVQGDVTPQSPAEAGKAAGPATPAEDPGIDFPEDRPLVKILGTVEVTGARGTVDSNRHTRALELAAFLVLHPGATAPQVDEVLSPRGGLTNPKTRNTRLRDVRRWLGLDDEGEPFFRRMAKHADGHRLVGVECDWIQFQLLHDIALQVPRAQGVVLLHRALELVRGRPFSGVRSTYYSWAEPIVEEINDTVVNSASMLANWHLEAGNGRGALWAAGRGLEVAREREELWRHRLRALALLGDHSGLEDAIRRLETLLVDNGWAMEEETAETIRMAQVTRR
ncbi:LysM peptidoglycan-binding domain-containing protein [Streptomyces sp. NPDC048370]|uniref:LysM peptidoglycan-binding domain-containing protein n=1 Tax=Streptomyces sp. NPDC048370 TaxID=3365540 RepID=UPI00370FC9E5